MAVKFLDELVEAAFWKSQQSGKTICNLNGWRATVRNRIQEQGPSPEDWDCLKMWRQAVNAPPPPETPLTTELINPDSELRERRMNMLNSASKKLKGLT